MTTKTFPDLLLSGPSFLFLGQSYLTLESGEDPLLTAIYSKYAPKSVRNAGYGVLLGNQGNPNAESTLAWIQNCCERMQVPPWLRTVAGHTWSSVYSSAIDFIWLRAFENDWREIFPVFDESTNPLDPRNRSRLHCTFLFGSVDRNTPQTRPPLSKFDFLNRRQIAAQLARRLPQQITPAGILAIEGYDPSIDWFEIQELVPVINQMNQNQVHFFSASNVLMNDQYLSELARIGKVQFHQKSLATTLLEMHDGGKLELGAKPNSESKGRNVSIERERIAVPRNVWNTTIRSAIILDSELANPATEMSEERRYREFRHFLAESGVQPIWSGFASGFAFERAFEQELRQKTLERLGRKELSDEPILLEGQTGTGKTIALGSLAFGVARTGLYPVLFIPKRTQRPVVSDIDTFCKWAEDSGAKSTLLVWDGMTKEDSYFDMVMNLSGLGRKVVLVGSTYELGERYARAGAVVHARGQMDESESSAFITFLNEFEPNLGNYVSDRSSTADQSFLVALYRVLPETRAKIRSGVVSEVGLAEDELLKKAKVSSTKPSLDNALGHALISAGIISVRDLISEDRIEFGGENLTGAEHLTALIMIPGKFGLKTPLDLLLRTMGVGGYRDLLSMISEMAIFSWEEDSIGNIFIGPRHRLEAELLTQARYGGPQFEIEIAKRLISELKSADDRPENPEIQFVHELLVAMGPESKSENRYARYWLELSKALRKLREERGIQIDRFIMKEANFSREYVRFLSKAGNPPEDTETILEDAESILLDRLSEIENSSRTKKIRNTIYSELAAVHGTRLVHSLRNSEDKVSAKRSLEGLYTAFSNAWSLDPENYYPFDILSWSTESILRSPIELALKQKAKAEILHYLGVAEDLNLSHEAQLRLDQRRMTIGKLIGDQKMSEEAYNKLKDSGQAIAYYLRAREILGDVAYQAELTDSERVSCQEAYSYLEVHLPAIRSDAKCLYLMLACWWKSKTGRRFFFGERSTVPLDREGWTHFITLLRGVMATEEFRGNLQLKFFEGLSLFHMDEFENSFTIFRELERESRDMRGRRRIIKSYLSSQADGMPQSYAGEVASVDLSKNRGELYVAQLRRNILFFPREFNRPEIVSGEPINPFHIAFNFLGVKADPVEFL